MPIGPLHSGQYLNAHTAVGFLETAEKQKHIAEKIYPLPVVTLSPEQQAVCNSFKTAVFGSNSDRLCTIQGKACSGKSLLISLFASSRARGTKIWIGIFQTSCPTGAAAAVKISGNHTFGAAHFCEQKVSRARRRRTSVASNGSRNCQISYH